MSITTGIADKFEIVDQNHLQQMGLKPAWIAKHSRAMGCLGRNPRRWLLSRVLAYIEVLAEEAQRKAEVSRLRKADNMRSIRQLAEEITTKQKNKRNGNVSDFEAYFERQGGVAKKNKTVKGRR